MGQRMNLQKILEKILKGPDFEDDEDSEDSEENKKGAGNVYFQPPESIKIKYPAIIYNLDYIKSQHGDNISYTNTRRYSVTLITKDPDTDIIDRILELPMCSFERFFTSDNLNHYVFNLYY